MKIVFIYFSNDFCKDLIGKNYLENTDLREWLISLTKDNQIYFVGDKTILRKNYLDQNSYKNTKINSFLQSVLNTKVEWIDLNKNISELRENNIIPIDYFLISENDTKNKGRRFLNFNLITKKGNLEKINNYLNTEKKKFIRIKIERNDNPKKIIELKSQELRNQFLKIMCISNKLIIWDRYIANFFFFPDKKTKTLKTNQYMENYRTTLKFFNDYLFKISFKKNSCEILSFNYQDRIFFNNFDKYLPILKEKSQNYINSLKNAKGVFYLKNVNKIDFDAWGDLHDRFLFFLDDFGELVSYFQLNQGFDFIKNSPNKRMTYDFTPLFKENYYEHHKKDIDDIRGLPGLNFKNTI